MFKELTKRVVAGRLIYPAEVITELKQTQGSTPFYPYEWAETHRAIAAPKTPLFADVKDLLQDPQISLVLDPSKTGPPEEADPYVLALALREKRNGHEVVVLSQERIDRPRKLSINTACGLLTDFPQVSARISAPTDDVVSHLRPALRNPIPPSGS